MAIAGLIGMVLAVTVGIASVRHPPGTPASARPGHSTAGTAAGPLARQPSSATPKRKASQGASPGNTGTVPVVVSNHRAITGSMSPREKIPGHRDGGSADHSRGLGNGNRHGNGHGNDNGNGQGNENAQVLSISS